LNVNGNITMPIEVIPSSTLNCERSEEKWGGAQKGGRERRRGGEERRREQRRSGK
jgi:ribose 5-phosphate isomerase